MSVFFWVSFAVLWLIVVVQGLAFLEVLRQISQIRRQMGPRKGVLIMQGAVQTGEPLPTLTGYSAKNRQSVRWNDYLKKSFGLIVSLSTHCSTCRSIATDLTGFANDVQDDTSVIILIEGTADDVESFISKAHLDRRLVIVDEDGTTAQAIGVPWTPAAVTVRNGKIGEAAILDNIDQLGALIPTKEEDNVIVG